MKNAMENWLDDVGELLIPQPVIKIECNVNRNKKYKIGKK